MQDIDHPALAAALAAIHTDQKGPGGAIGVVKDGQVVLAHSWGHADVANHIPVTARTRFPICSISKQFTCAILQGIEPDLSRFDRHLESHLPKMENRPSVRDLCNNQSGLRDYWALTVLHGADAEGVFARKDAAELFSRMKTTHFAPGTAYSYSNGNFRILSDIIEAETGRSLGDLYRENIFGPAGMQTAELIPDTAGSGDPIVGYEGNDAVGFFPATNRILWTGDAGIVASLEDMLAWEKFIDATRDDENGIYRRLAEPQAFADGSDAFYGNGLSHGAIGTIRTTGHGGALRGFRLHRLHAPSKRLSVVVLFNHENDAGGTANKVMKAALGIPADEPLAPVTDGGWDGAYLDRETGLLLQVSKSEAGLSARIAGSAETLSAKDRDTIGSDAMTLSRNGDTIHYTRWRENLTGTAIRVTGTARPDISGCYHCDELEAGFTIIDTGGAIYGFFEGVLGTGEMAPLYPVGTDVWTLPCRRSMDAPAPGDWTVQIHRDAHGAIEDLTIGCWLARNLHYRRIGG
ncbi:D-aminopeptidase [Pseudohoeflea suaedae]|uniref:D-aminopeptidase n=1 Tax=Pseudohoeflea suaedae TaxID=877384 RepID=A0A4R5PI85_9HYPH|nr:D-aminopeptidase [Pseudohoeflea suaedae]TDH34943.1 D-aminopeptidase [Pseudohoeflea suaedae]